MSAHHAVVWIDHQQARVFKFYGTDEVEKVDLHGTPHHHIHNRAAASGRREEDHPYYQAVAEAIGDAAESLVVGPGGAKLELIKHIHQHRPELAPRLIGVETVDHPTDGQLVAYARKYFRKADRMH